MTKTVTELVKAMQREFTEIDSINENLKELKDEAKAAGHDAKAAGHDAAMLARLAKAMAEGKTDEVIDKSQAFIDLADAVRNS